MRAFLRTTTAGPLSALATVSTCLLLALQAGCGNVDRNTLAPLPASPSATIAGSAHAAGGAGLQGVVVTLEAIDGDVSASVQRTISQLGSSAKSLKAGVSPLGSAAVATPSRSAVTDAGGRFAFTNVSPGTYLMTGIAQNHIAGVARSTVKPLASPSAVETTFVDIAMMPTGKFYGTVTLENATNHQSTVVYVDGSSYVAVTNAAGAYLIEGVPVGNWTVRGTHPGYLDRSVNGSIGAAGDSLPLASFQLPLNSNIPPTANPAAPTSPVAHTLTGLSGSASDADGSIVRYEWDFTNDGTFDYTSPSTASTTHDYGTSGTYTAKLRVTDNDGAIGLAVVTVNVVDGVFVSATGNDGNPGTYDQPVQTIGMGFTLAGIFNRTYIYIATGTYNETPSFPVGTEVRGGMTTGTTWTQTLGNYSIVNVGTTPATVSGANIATRVSGLDIRASNQVTAGATSIAVSISNSTSALLFYDCKFTAGNGAAGISKSPGASGGHASGAPGQAGGIGGVPGGGNGGGGAGGGGPGSNGGFGTTGGNSCGGSNSGGNGGNNVQCSNGGTGGNGINFCPAVDGSNGAALSSFGQTVSGVWNPAAGNNGVNGQGGAGGGGGGGGGGSSSNGFCPANGTGGAGGGGGGGGGYGAGGAGGNGGGASFAVFLYNALPSFTNCYFTSKNGGNGGNGGSGGLYGNPGSGAGGATGTGTSTIGGTGGTGATGIRGGGGGAGGGGAGGITACLGLAGISGGTFDSNSYTVGLPGNGGTGGVHPVTFVQAPTGLTGSASQTVTLSGN